MSVQNQVKFTFTALNDNFELPKRVLTLDPQHQLVQIGRSSKSASKGIRPSADNAWFDSPVVSRTHAELFLDPKTQAVILKDIGSLHGTFVNEYQLKKFDWKELQDGDHVVFGAEVKRNGDTFPACAFIINYDISPFKVQASYAFPGYDDEGEDEEGSIRTKSEPNRSNSGTPIETSKAQGSCIVAAIDLTGEDSTDCSDLDDRDTDVSLRGVSHSENEGSNSIVGTSPPPAHETLESECGNEGSCEDTSEARDKAEIVDSQPHSLIRPLSILGHVEAARTGPEKQPVDHWNEVSSADPEDEAIRALFDSESVRDDEIVDEDEQLTNMQSRVVANGLTTLIPRLEGNFSVEMTSALAEAMNATSEGQSLGDSSDDIEQSINQIAATTSTSTIPNPEETIYRQQSPSPVALTNTGPRNPTDTISELHMPNRDFKNITNRTFAEKTVKHDFFAAREVNKVRVSGLGAVDKTKSMEGLSETMSKEMISDPSIEEEDVDSSLILPTRPEPSDIDNSLVSEMYTDVNNPELDTSSAVEESAIHVHNVPPDTLMSHDRSGQKSVKGSICTYSSISKPLKRKIDKISDDTIEKHLSNPTAPSTSNTISKSKLTSENPDKAPARVSIENRPPRQGPARKLQKCVEGIAYGALGGAVIFGVLVWSAPDFA